MRTRRCPITQKEKTYENISCFNLQSCARVCGRRCARRKQIKEASPEEKAGAISAARSRAERRTTESKRVTAGDYDGGTPGGCWSTEDEKGKRPAAGDYDGGTPGGRWNTEDEREDERVTTDRYIGWADSGRCSARPEDKEIERERDQRRRGSVEH